MPRAFCAMPYCEAFRTALLGSFDLSRTTMISAEVPFTPATERFLDYDGQYLTGNTENPDSRRTHLEHMSPYR